MADDHDPKTMKKACVIGSGPNGLSAAIVLAHAGWSVEVYEAESQPGGGVRSMELTLPGFIHDFGSAVHPMAAGSPFFSRLPLAKYGLEWIHSPSACAHPLDDGTAIILERDINTTSADLKEDGPAWRKLFEPVANRWFELAPDLLGPVPLLPRHPWQMARLGLRGFPSARWIANRLFRTERAKVLFAGLAAHSVLSLDEPLSSAFGIIIGAIAHAIGWPIPRGGAQSITNALLAHLASLGGIVKTSSRVDRLSDLPQYDLTLCDVTPRQLVQIAGNRLTDDFKLRLSRWQYGPGVFKVDYALSEPIPWKAKECLRAATVHVGGTFEEIVASEHAMRNGQVAEKPFMILAQPTLFDPSRAPEGKHIAWTYCHVPNSSTIDMLPRIEAQIERFAPGFRDCVLARRIFAPADLEKMDGNLIGGDIGGGAINMPQFIFRPTGKTYSTSAPDIFLCSSSTPPGGGVHGMCGYHAARIALSRVQKR